MGTFVAIRQSWMKRYRRQAHLNMLWRMFVRNPTNSWMTKYRYRATHFVNGRRVSYEERM